MIKVSYDGEYNTAIVEFRGNIDATQAEQFFIDIEKVLPRHGKGFKLLTDFSSVDTMELEVQRAIKKAMEFFNAQGVTEILRVIPDPAMEIGFNAMSTSRYSKKVKVHTLRSRQEAQAHLRKEKQPVNSNKLEVRDAVIFITGANRGIGKALVEIALEQGAKKVYAAARKPETLKQMVEKNPGRVIPIELDVTSEQQVQEAAKQAPDVTLLVNNAGTASMGGFTANYNAEGARNDMQTNYFGTLNMAIAFAPILKNNGGGAIVNIVSVAGLQSFPFATGYSASKAAAHSLTQGLRQELAEQKTFVAGVYPGPVDTDMARGVEMEKESPRQVALSVYRGVEEGSEEIYPDKYAVEFRLSLKAKAADR